MRSESNVLVILFSNFTEIGGLQWWVFEKLLQNERREWKLNDHFNFDISLTFSTPLMICIVKILSAIDCRRCANSNFARMKTNWYPLFYSILGTVLLGAKKKMSQQWEFMNGRRASKKKKRREKNGTFYWNAGRFRNGGLNHVLLSQLYGNLVKTSIDILCYTDNPIYVLVDRFLLHFWDHEIVEIYLYSGCFVFCPRRSIKRLSASKLNFDCPLAPLSRL